MVLIGVIGPLTGNYVTVKLSTEEMLDMCSTEILTDTADLIIRKKKKNANHVYISSNADILIYSAQELNFAPISNVEVRGCMGDNNPRKTTHEITYPRPIIK